MKKLLFVATLNIMLLANPGFGASMKFSDLAKDEAFAKGTPEQRLEYVNKKLESKELKSSDINIDLTSRLLFDALKDEKDQAKRLDLYGQLRGKNSKLSQTYELESSLICGFLASIPEGQKSDLPAMMKMIQKFQDEKKVSWPAVAPLHEGMLAAYLIAHADYQKMSVKDKLVFIKKLAADKVIAELTSSKFSRGVVSVALSEAGPDKIKALFDELKGEMDFFTKSFTQGGYEP